MVLYIFLVTLRHRTQLQSILFTSPSCYLHEEGTVVLSFFVPLITKERDGMW